MDRMYVITGLFQGREKPLVPRQVSLVDIRTGQVKRLTKGSFQHTVCDTYKETYLVVRNPLGRGDRAFNYLRGDLYEIKEPR